MCFLSTFVSRRGYYLLEFRVKEAYSKIREEYRLDGCQVCLDHISNIGWFVEIEGPPKKIREMARKLGLRPLDREHRSYRKLIKKAAVLPLDSYRVFNGSPCYEAVNCR